MNVQYDYLDRREADTENPVNFENPVAEETLTVNLHGRKSIINREGGFVLEDDENWYFQFAMGEDTIGDTMVVHFYDWDKQPIGDIVFKQK